MIGWLPRPPRVEDAPAWAKWLAQDEDGMWGWFSYKPVLMAFDDSRPEYDRFWGCPEGEEYDALLRNASGNSDEIYEGAGRTLTPLNVEQMLFEVKRSVKED
jgi:hypothetical protein